MLSLDVRADDSARACVDAAFSRSGRFDVLINNAGYELAGAVEELSTEEAMAQFETNFFGVIRMVNAVLPHMRRERSWQIINVGSLAGDVRCSGRGRCTGPARLDENFCLWLPAGKSQVRRPSDSAPSARSTSRQWATTLNRSRRGPTTERYLGWKQRRRCAVDDLSGIEPDAA
jgi:NAD(P)-dependent dehydrogenase (short-subunit alcohol dehydrogenase family)